MEGDEIRGGLTKKCNCGNLIIACSCNWGERSNDMNSEAQSDSAYQEQDGWISVEDRLPMIWQDVIITGEDWGWRNKFGFMQLVDGRKEWFDSWCQINQTTCWESVITHWRPAPYRPSTPA